jgi:hypothetical protein
MTPSYPHTLHWPASLSVHRDDHYHSDPTFFLGRNVVITEKLDGGIATINQGQVYARSSGAPTTQPWFSYMKGITVPKLYGLPPTICVIGEDLFGIHSIEYDPLPDTFFMFHVLDRLPENVDTENTAGDVFWSWDAACELASQYGLGTVPELFRGKFEKIDEITEFFLDNVSRPSIYGPNREGFVMRVTEYFPFDEFEFHVAKFVRANHVQTDEHWTRNWKSARLRK